jgi:hypothetical protein
VSDLLVGVGLVTLFLNERVDWLPVVAPRAERRALGGMMATVRFLLFCDYRTKSKVA